jgi:hypothetical protein
MSRPIFHHTIHVSLEVWLLVLLLGAFGCDSGKKSQITGTSVSGVVRYQGKPITGGVVLLWSDHQDGNNSAQGRIKGDGTFQVLNAPVGACKVVVNTEAAKHDRSTLRKMAPETARTNIPEPEGPPIEYMPIDPKYSSLKTTPIKITVEKGSQTRDLELP